jgi:hypothetical protein
MFKHSTFLVFLLFLSSLATEVWARPERIDQIPNGTLKKCSNCHINPAGGGARNAFGQDVESAFLDMNGKVIWSYALARLDSDGDGLPNGVELGDANAYWASGDPALGQLDRIRLPGDALSRLGDVLTVQFTNMTPHLGEKFEIRVVDIGNRSEVTRSTLAAIASADFQLFFEGIEIGHSYRIDFYADHNQNGEYDKPNNDHAWRIQVDNVQGDTIVVFNHNTNFTDITWPYQVTIQFAAMTPHVGQMLELRLINRKTLQEISRKTISAIESVDFSVYLPGTEINEDYWIDFYADHNNNKLYDAPPTDHAWRLELEDVSGDAQLNFTHNTGFTEIQWKYLLTLQLSNMTPHLGQLFEMRVIDLLTQKEVGRQKVESIIVPNFEVSIPNIDPQGYYQLDFYADHSKNGLYDVPGTDHAWRLKSPMTTGNSTVDFTHNTNFTNIDWTYLFILEVSNLEPHANQLFEMRITDQGTGLEVGRARLESVYVSEFTLTAPGLRLNRSYNVDFYADHNNNKLYDAPPTDHAWRLNFSNGDDGDNEISFTHNTNFTDIDWAYLFTLDLSSMTPHLGQLFELVLINQGDMSEVGRVHVDGVPSPDFLVSVGGIRAGNYQADFYADHNGNGSYNSPPTDHAWRQEIAQTSGDYVLDFVHNTNFVDIGFPTAIDAPLADGMPVTYRLQQNYPNPFNPSTTIRFDLPAAGSITLAVFNNLGQRIRTLVENNMAAGSHEVVWDGRDEAGMTMSSGVYFYQIHSESFREVKRMLLVK